ncbi:cell envelope biogenesis protein OmpA [Flavivirga aquatica]|uniref:Cell envelope biogenesis protein OmpA n=1 Tax=Flavivirga aquatica TaxID=1849968 RepID=A0A1E5T416_9FLAO|nr:OmpA family protein [Flavivirga aquatica]OEK06124.1 cell envelope biogenesis protein OmpA [Flavivirga aquatica]
MKKISMLLLVALVFSCVSKKKYVALEEEKGQIESELTKTKVANEELEAKFQAIQTRVDSYNSKISSLKEDIGTLTKENNSKLDVIDNGTVISNDAKVKMRATLAKVDPAKLSQAKTLKDSMNLAVAHNLEKTMQATSLKEDEDIAVNINETVVMISISDKMLFNSGSYQVSSKANKILQKLADVINSEESLEVMVEGHTDSRGINTEKISDNWDLSVLRATSVVRKLQNKFKVAPEKMIAAGRSSFQPLTDNKTPKSRARNRRTRIVILPNIDKFFALMGSSNEEI